MPVGCDSTRICRGLHSWSQLWNSGETRSAAYRHGATSCVYRWDWRRLSSLHPTKIRTKWAPACGLTSPGLCGKGRCSSNSAICLGTYPFMNIPAEWHTRRVVRSTDRWWKLETTGLLNRPTIGPLRWLSSGRRGAFDFASIIDDSTGGKGGDPPPLPQLATSSWPISPHSTWLVDLGRYQGTRTIVPKQRYHPRRPVPIQTDAFRSVQCVRNPPEAKGLRTRLPEVVQVFCLSWWWPDPR